MAKKSKKPPVSSRKPRPGTKAAKPAKKAASQPKPRPRPSAGGQLVTFICAECYEDFTIDSGRMGDTVTCPECLHVGKRPQENFLAQVSETKGREKKILLAAAVLAIVAGLLGLGTALVLSPYGESISQALGADTAMYVFGGGFALLAIVGIVMAVQYEKNRWEVYF